MKLEEIHWDEPDAKRYLLECGGSKAGAYEYLHERHPELRGHLPKNSAYLAPGDDIDAFVAALKNTDAPKVVRGCHALDVTGMVDVIPTSVDVLGKGNIRKAIQELMQRAQAENVRSYVEYESGNPFDGKIGIQVADYCGQNRGSIIEHPHERGVYRIGRISPTYTSILDEDEDACDEYGKAMDIMRMRHDDANERKYKSSQSINENEAQNVIRLYRSIAETGLIPATHSFQMEYGIDRGNTMFYQGRLFKPFDVRRDFPVDEDYSSSSSAYDTFGITPEEGIEMPLAELTTEFIDKYKSEKQVCYAYNAYGHRQTTDLDVQPRNVTSYLPYQPHVLEHGHYRWLQKADTSIVGIRYLLSRSSGKELHDSLQGIHEEIRIRIRSNGVLGSIMVLE